MEPSTRKVQIAEYGQTGQVGILVLSQDSSPMLCELKQSRTRRTIKRNRERERLSYRKPTIWVSII